MLNEVAEGRITPERLAWVMAEVTSHLYGLYPRKGTVQPGADADLTLVNMETPSASGMDGVAEAVPCCRFCGESW